MDSPERFRSACLRAPQELLTKDGLLLRTRVQIDTRAWYKMIAENSDHLGRFLPWTKDYPEEQSAIHHLEACDMIRRGQLATYGIYKEGSLIGAVSLYGIRETSAKLGYWLTQDAEGQRHGLRWRNLSVMLWNFPTKVTQAGTHDIINLPTTDTIQRCLLYSHIRDVSVGV